jgi:hypothetical protein
LRPIGGQRSKLFFCSADAKSYKADFTMYFAICNEAAPLFQAVKSATAAKKDDSFADLFPRNGREGVFAGTPGASGP